MGKLIERDFRPPILRRQAVKPNLSGQVVLELPNSSPKVIDLAERILEFRTVADEMDHARSLDVDLDGLHDRFRAAQASLEAQKGALNPVEVSIAETMVSKWTKDLEAEAIGELTSENLLPEFPEADYAHTY